MDLEFLRKIDLFHNFDAVQLAHIASIIEQVPLKKNAKLFAEGDPAEHLYLIVSGRIRISKVVPGIGEEAMAILEAGSYFGEMELLDPDTPRAAQALAHEESLLYAIAYRDFTELMSTDSQLGMAFLWSISKTLARRLRDTNDKVTAMFALAQF